MSMTFERIRIATLLAFTIFMGLFVSPVNAQMNIEIKGVGQTLYPIAIARFKDQFYLTHRNFAVFVTR